MIRVRQRRSRRGLAPLEMVLAIPILMFVVGLSVIFAVVACWKVRSESVGRDAVWSCRWPRWGTGVPQPLEWTPPASRTWRQGGPLAALDHQAFQHPLIQGPLPNNLAVNSQLFDPTLGLRIGEAQTTRTPPALGRLGPYSLDVEVPILDGKWQYGQQGIGSNTNRRVPIIYPNLLDPPQTQALRMQYQQAIQAVVTAPCQPGLAVLDRDQEIFAWYGYSPDFHPRFPRFCALETDYVRTTHLPGHLYRVDCHTPPGQRSRGAHGVPADLTNFFLRMYRHQKWVLQNSIPPGTPAQIAALDQKIAILQAFLDQLKNL
jgi:hypothetical protein